MSQNVNAPGSAVKYKEEATDPDIVQASEVKAVQAVQPPEKSKYNTGKKNGVSMALDFAPTPGPGSDPTQGGGSRKIRKSKSKKSKKSKKAKSKKNVRRN